jgi:hypothetical protein
MFGTGNGISIRERRVRKKIAQQCGVDPKAIPETVRWPIKLKRAKYEYHRIYIFVLNKVDRSYTVRWLDPKMPRETWDVLYNVPEYLQLDTDRIYDYKGPVPENKKKKGKQKFKNMWGNARIGATYMVEGSSVQLAVEDMYPATDYYGMTPLLLKEFVDHDPAMNWTDSVNKSKFGGKMMWIMAIVGAVIAVIAVKALGVI